MMNGKQENETFAAHKKILAEQGIKEQDPRVVYADIIDHPHHVSTKHPHMSMEKRAAQFAPFAALSGYGEMLAETLRTVDPKIELSEDDAERLSRKLNQVQAALGAGGQPTVQITYFVPDRLKKGGKYETVTEQIRRIDTAHGKIILARTEGFSGSYVEINIDDVLDITGECIREEWDE